MYFKAVVTDEEVKIRSTNDIKEAMLAVTMICHNVNEIKEYSESDRFVFRKFVTEELARMAFTDTDGLIKEEKRLKELFENAKAQSKAGNTNLRRLLKELGDLLSEVEDEDEDEDEDET